MNKVKAGKTLGSLTLQAITLIRRYEMRNAIVKLLVIILLGCCLSQANAEDVLTINDNPTFKNTGQSIWGPGDGEAILEFDAALIDINPDGDEISNNKLWGVTQIFTPATKSNPQFLCGSDSFIDLFTDDCYTCPDGFTHDWTKDVDDEGVCFERSGLTTADPAGDIQIICPSGQFPDILLQDCYSCPSGYVQNPIIPVQVDGACVSGDTQQAQREGDAGCSSGEFPDVGLNSCYSCPSGYTQNLFLKPDESGVCWKLEGDNTTATYCGTTGTSDCNCDEVCTWYGWPVYDYGWPCWDDCDSCSNNWCGSGFVSTEISGWNLKMYECPSGYTHDPVFAPDKSGVCFKLPTLDTTTATYEHSYDCPSGQTDGLNGYCYSCPSGYTYVVGGACVMVGTTYAEQHDPVVFFCDEGEFISLNDWDCYTCPAGLEHDLLKSADEVGVCYEEELLTATFDGSQYICPSGYFFNLLDGRCYSCPDDSVYLPFLNPDIACYALAFSDDPADGDFELGYEFASLFRFKAGFKGGISVNRGSVDVTYSPEISVTLSAGDDTPEGLKTFVINTNQLDGSTLDMQTSWPEIFAYLDPWIDAELKTEISVSYPKLGGDEFNITWSQAQDDLPLPYFSTYGPKTLANDPLFSFNLSEDGSSISVLGMELPIVDIFDYLSGEYKRKIKDDRLGIEVNTVIIEWAIQPPTMNTPTESTTDPITGEDVPYNGAYSEEEDFGPGDTTFISQHLDAGERTGLNWASLDSGILKDPDLFSFELDLDGILSYITNVPLGVNVSQGLPDSLSFLEYLADFGDLWSVSADLLDLDLGVILTFASDYKFQPKLKVKLTFSTSVQVIREDGSVEDSTEHSTDLGEELKFIHPGGKLTIDTAYSLENNSFTNDTDLNWTGLLGGEVGSFGISLLSVPGDLLPRFTIVDFALDFNELFNATNANELLEDAGLNFDVEQPWKVVDVNFFDDNESSIFTLEGFTDMEGSQLVITSGSDVGQCTYSLSSTEELFINADSNTGSTSVNTDYGCEWTAISNDDWITVTNITYAIGTTGNGTIDYSVSANTGDSVRQGTITIAGKTFTVIQTAPSQTGDPIPGIKANGSDGPITIGADEELSIEISLSAADHVGEECDWWLFVSTPSGLKYFDLDKGFTSEFTVTKQGAIVDLGPTTMYEISGLGAGTYTYYFGIDLDVDGKLLNSAFYSDSVEVTVEEGPSGQCTYSLSSTEELFINADSDTDSTSVNTDYGCEWTAISNDDWITVTSVNYTNAIDTTGNGTIDYSVSANTGDSARQGTITIAGETFTVTQSASSQTGDENPIPGIKANDSDGPITIGADEELSIEISLSAGDHVGEECDWWLFVSTPSGLEYFDSDKGFTSELTVTKQGAIVDLGPTTMYEISGLGAGTYTYYFGIDLDMDGELNGAFYSDSVKVTVEEDPSGSGGAEIPTGLSATVSGNTVTLNWNAVDGAEGYNVYYGYSSGSYAKYLDLGNVESVTNSGVPGGEYYLALTAYDSDGEESGYSKEIELVVGGSSVPTNVTATTSDCVDVFGSTFCAINFNWTSVSGADGYKLYYGFDSGAYSGSLDLGNVTSQSFSGISGGIYYFVLTAYSGTDESSYSGETRVEVGPGN